MSCNVITAGHCRGPVWVNTVRPCVGTSSATAEMSFLWTEKPAEMSLPRLQSLSALITNTMNSGQTGHRSWKDYQLPTPPAHGRQSGGTALLSESAGKVDIRRDGREKNVYIYDLLASAKAAISHSCSDCVAEEISNLRVRFWISGALGLRDGWAVTENEM